MGMKFTPLGANNIGTSALRGYFRARTSTSFVVPTASFGTALSSTHKLGSIDNEVTDVEGWYSTANSRFTPLIEGIYLLRGKITTTTAVASGSGGFDLGVLRNGSLASEVYSSERIVSNNGTVGMQISWRQEVYADGVDDYLELCAYAAAATEDSQIEFSGYLLGTI